MFAAKETFQKVTAREQKDKKRNMFAASFFAYVLHVSLQCKISQSNAREEYVWQMRPVAAPTWVNPEAHTAFNMYIDSISPKVDLDCYSERQCFF